MYWIQNILAFLILLVALAYLVHKFVYPLPFLSLKKKNDSSCGGPDCGCH